ncbi:DUF6069 family protein [Streptomyces sp. SID13031]|uniref:DUF6069 family protein n=1 Tax=Streptomyces sp. SID13031 TaxID=2706046 RepID=UPI0013C729E3|nr:hypothetical protein [Streptomyces sp. SID13031]
MTTLSTVGGVRTRSPHPGKLACAAVLAIVVASLGNALLALIGKSAFSVPGDFKGFQPGAYIFLTVISIVGASVAWSAIAAKAAKPVALLRKLAVIIVPVSMLADVALLVTGQSPAGVAVLLVMHVVVGLAAYFALTRIAPPRPAR